MENFRPFVYGLVDPAEPGHVRYVGMASVRASRPQEHSKNAHGKRAGRIPHLALWIRKLHSKGREYGVLILEELREDTSRKFLGFVEKCYIKSLRAIGHDLINIAEGGDGGKMGEMSPEGRARNAAAMIGNTRTLGYKHSDESNTKRSESSRRYFAEHPEAGARSGATRLGIKQSPETCLKKSLVAKGHHRGAGIPKHSQEFKDNLSARNLGNMFGAGTVHSEESKIQVGDALRRYNADPANRSVIAERRVRQSETMKALHAKKKAAKCLS